MGMYTGIRFSGLVKPIFRLSFIQIAEQGLWDMHYDQKIRQFSKFHRAEFIPMGALAYMPREWGEWYQPIYNQDTGYWQFQCSLKNYENEIEHWLEYAPYYLQEIYFLEYYYEEWAHSHRYELIDGTIKLVDAYYHKYQETENVI